MNILIIFMLQHKNTTVDGILHLNQEIKTLNDYNWVKEFLNNEMGINANNSSKIIIKPLTKL